MQQLWAGVTSGRPFLLELRQTGPPHGARTYTGSRCSCPPAPTSPKKCPVASGRSSEYSERWKALPTLRARAVKHQGDVDIGGGRRRVHAPNVTVVRSGKPSWEAILRDTYPHDGGCDQIYHQSLPERNWVRWSKARNSRNINGPLAVRCFAMGNEKVDPIGYSSRHRSRGGGIVHNQRVHRRRHPSHQSQHRSCPTTSYTTSCPTTSHNTCPTTYHINCITNCHINCITNCITVATILQRRWSLRRR